MESVYVCKLLSVNPLDFKHPLITTSLESTSKHPLYSKNDRPLKVIMLDRGVI